MHPCLWLGSHLRWLQIGLRPWLAKAAANLPQQRQQQHLQLWWHRLLQWQQQRGSSRCNSARAAVAGCTLTVGAAGRGLDGAGGVRRLCPCGSRYALAAWALPLWFNTQQSNSNAAAAAGGRIGSSGGSSSGSCGCIGCGGSSSRSVRGRGRWQHWQQWQQQHPQWQLQAAAAAAAAVGAAVALSVAAAAAEAGAAAP
jgi:hypothetical protein